MMQTLRKMTWIDGDKSAETQNEFFQHKIRFQRDFHKGKSIHGG